MCVGSHSTFLHYLFSIAIDHEHLLRPFCQTAGMMILTRIGPDERCAPGSLHCCHCKNRVSIGFRRSSLATEKSDTDTDLPFSE